VIHATAGIILFDKIKRATVPSMDQVTYLSILCIGLENHSVTLRSTYLFICVCSCVSILCICLENNNVLLIYLFMSAAPHQPRLDFQMWFAARRNYQQNNWLLYLAYRLLTQQKEGQLATYRSIYRVYSMPPQFCIVFR